MEAPLQLSEGCICCNDKVRLSRQFIDNAIAQFGENALVPERIKCPNCRREIVFNLLPHAAEDEHSGLYREMIMTARTLAP